MDKGERIGKGRVFKSHSSDFIVHHRKYTRDRYLDVVIEFLEPNVEITVDEELLQKGSRVAWSTADVIRRRRERSRIPTYCHACDGRLLSDRKMNCSACRKYFCEDCRFLSSTGLRECSM